MRECVQTFFCLLIFAGIILANRFRVEQRPLPKIHHPDVHECILFSRDRWGGAVHIIERTCDWPSAIQRLRLQLEAWSHDHEMREELSP